MGVILPLRAPVSAQGAARDRTDAELVIAARQGQQWAKEQLYRRHVRLVVGLAHRVLPNDPEVDDLVQDSFVAAFEGLPRLENPQAFASFVASITVRGARRRIRHRKVLRRLGIRRVDATERERAVSSEAPPDVGAELRALYAIIDDLPSDVRIALVLRRVEGLTIPAISELMELSPATVKRRLADGEWLLAERLGDQ
jgi:RNA polymerase sigma-70 factor (ECF subfamily)